MKDDPLSGPKSKIKRANQHIADVETQIIAFLRNPPPPIATFKEVNADGTRESLKISQTKRIPDDISAAIGDTVNNLRSALDHLACCLATHNGATNISGTYFPFAGNKQEFELAATQRKIKRLSSSARDLISALQPYKGGNTFLWTLNKLATQDKHQSLVAIAAVPQGWHGLFEMQALSTEPHVFEAARWVRLDQDQAILRYPAGGNFEGELEITVDVAFDEIEPIKNQPVLTVLNQHAGLVKRIILLFENRIFKP